MKKLLLAVVICVSLSATAQINVGSRSIAVGNDPGKLKKGDIEELKNTTTLFTLQWKDYDHIADFEKVIASVWKVSKFKIIKPDEMDKYMKQEGYSFFSFGGYYSEKTNSAGAQSLFSMHVTYDLWIPEIGKKGNVKGQSYFSRTLLMPDAELYKAAQATYNKKFKDNMLSFLYNDASFNNWGAGFLKGYLATVNRILMNDDWHGMFSSDQKMEALEGLKNDTLYIPDYIKVHYNAFTGAEKDKEKDEDDLHSFYSNKLKLVTAAQLNDMILNRSTPFYYLVYVRAASDKFVNVYHTDNAMVFARYIPLSYNFNNKDLFQIDRLLK